MQFPETERVIYNNNPLQQVICQLRFPTILRIEASTPAGFQERIRKEFPLFQEHAEFAGILPPEIVQLLSQEVIQTLKPSHKVYAFTSSEESLVVNLSSGFVSLTSSNYERWESFKNRLMQVLNALQEEYSPAHFTRIGLRYRNLIQKRVLRLQDADWPELLNENLIRELATPNLAESIEDIAHRILIRMGSSQTKVHLQHGLAKDASTNQLLGYGIDCDIFDEGEIDVDTAIDQLNEFNQLNRRLFRWCISDRLHIAMEPRPEN